jgi:hypothetical protein
MPSSKSIAPVADSAEYSPRLWPAQKLASMPMRSTGVEHHQARHERGQLSVASVFQLIGVGVEQQLADVAPGDLARLVDQFPALVIDPRRPIPGRCDP